MPGSIRVSVLEAFDLPAVASDGKYVSVKVSVGKREFQTKPSKTDNGKTISWNSDFVFPVLNLRDNLVVVLLGSKGEEISQNEIDMPSIVEKGSFEEVLILKGGGNVHLRLSFVLTEEERRRIEVMRAVALKRREHEISRLPGMNQSLQLTGEGDTGLSVPAPTIRESTTEDTDGANSLATTTASRSVNPLSEEGTGTTLNAPENPTLSEKTTKEVDGVNSASINLPHNEPSKLLIQEAPGTLIYSDYNETKSKGLLSSQLHSISLVLEQKEAGNEKNAMDSIGVDARLSFSQPVTEGIVAGKGMELKCRDSTHADAQALLVAPIEEGVCEKSPDSNIWTPEVPKEDSILPTTLIQLPDEVTPTKNIPLLDLNGTDYKSMSADKKESTCFPDADLYEVEKSIELDLPPGTPSLTLVDDATKVVLTPKDEAVYQTNKSFPVPANTVPIGKNVESYGTLLQTLESTNTPNSVKARVKAYEKSFSQDAGHISQLSPSQGGKLQGQKSVERTKSDGGRHSEEEHKPLQLEKGSLVKSTDRRLGDRDFGSVGVETGDGDLQDVRPRGNNIKDTISNMAQQHQNVRASGEGVYKAGNIDSDIVDNASLKRCKEGEYTAVKGNEDKNLNSSGILDVAKQVLGGVIMVAVGVFIWDRAANLERRRSSITQRFPGKKRE